MTLNATAAPPESGGPALETTTAQEPGFAAVGPTSDNSAGHKETTHAAAYLAFALIAVAIVTASGGGYLIAAHASGGFAPAAFVASAFAIVAAAVVPLGVKRESRLEREDAESRDADCRDLEYALLRARTSAVPEVLKRLTMANFRQVRSFTVIAQRQARMSYYASLIGAGMSLLVLLAGSAIAVGEPSLASKITAGSLAVLGTALSTFLSKTFLRTYDMSLRQMSYYYGQPLVHCYLYLAEWQTLMAPAEVNDQAKGELYQEVVRASLRASANAQHHLLSLHEHDPSGRRGGSFRQLVSPPGAAQPNPAAATLGDLFTATLRL